jgi:hypothetical protein
MVDWDESSPYESSPSKGGAQPQRDHRPALSWRRAANDAANTGQTDTLSSSLGLGPERLRREVPTDRGRLGRPRGWLAVRGE